MKCSRENCLQVPFEINRPPVFVDNFTNSWITGRYINMQRCIWKFGYAIPKIFFFQLFLPAKKRKKEKEGDVKCWTRMCQNKGYMGACASAFNCWPSIRTPLTKFLFSLERFSIECRKAKTKVITQANHNKHKLSNEMNQSELEAKTCNWRQARENACEQVVVKKVARDFLANQKAK